MWWLLVTNRLPIRVGPGRHECLWTRTPGPLQLIDFLELFASHDKAFLRIFLNNIRIIQLLLERTIELHRVVWRRRHCRVIHLFHWLTVQIRCTEYAVLPLLLRIFIIQTNLAWPLFSCLKSHFIAIILILLNLRMHFLLDLFRKLYWILQFNSQFAFRRFGPISCFKSFLWRQFIAF